ncbi:MAG: photosystem II stability/assembly factor-like uncharacterized protein, partial [Phenylobacterium sp.]
MNRLTYFSVWLGLGCSALLSLAVQSAQPAFMTPLAAKSLLTDIVKVGDGTASTSMVTVGDRGHILHSADGEHWQQAKVPVNVLLTDVFFLDDKKGWAVGHDATILASTDSGHSWVIQQHSPQVDKPLFGIHFTDDNNGITFGAYGMFYRTSDGGANWVSEFHGELLHPDDLDYINDLKANDPEGYKDETASILPHFNRLAVVGNTSYLVGETGLVAKSTDFGRLWQKSEPFYNGSFFALASSQSNGMYVAGLRGNIFYNSGQGDVANWQRLNVIVTTSINRVLNVGSNTGNKLLLMGNS